MKKLLLFLTLFLPLMVNAQNNNLRFSVDIGTSNVQNIETAALIGFKGFDDSVLELGYVYKRILNNNVQHNLNFHGIRLHAQVPFSPSLGVYFQYDVVKGTRYLYEYQKNYVTPQLMNKVYGEPVAGLYYTTQTPNPLSFHLGLSAFGYKPRVYELTGKTPHTSVTPVFKIRYSINTNFIW